LSGENQAISLLSLEKARAGQSLSAFAQISNFSSQPAIRRLELYADGELVDAAEVQIPARGQQAYLNQDLPLETQVLEARLGEAECPVSPAGGPCEPDALPLDDRAWAVQRAGGPTGLTLVTQGNRFLETALALLPEVEVTTVEPEGFEAAQPSDLAGQLVVFDAYTPITSTLPGGPLLFIGPPRSTGLFSVTGKVEAPAPRPLSPDDPLLANVNLAGISVLDSARLPLPEWAHTVIAGDVTGSPEDSVPLLFAGEVEGRRVAVLAFDLRRSDLPLQVAFPLLLANLTGWLSPGGGCPPPQEGQESAPCSVVGNFPTQAVAGQALSLPLPLEAQQVTLTRPDGSRSRLEPQAGQLVLAGLDQLGIYQLDWGTGGALTGGVRFAANLFLAQESDILPAGNLPLEGSDANAGGQVPQQARQEWWRPLALAAVILLVAEWLVYHRATLNRMLRMLKLRAVRS
jgi:hypothetical protein